MRQADETASAGSGSKLSQVMIKIEIAMAHALGLRKLAKHRLESKFALRTTEALKQLTKFLVEHLIEIYAACRLTASRSRLRV